MSLAARCPWCETVFRLTEAQISAKGGMVRCGVCGHSFNAVDALLSDAAVAALEAKKSNPDAIEETPPEASTEPPADQSFREPEETSLDEFLSEKALVEEHAAAVVAPVSNDFSSPVPKGRTLNDLRLRPMQITEPAPELEAATEVEPAVEEEELLGPSTYHPSFLGPLEGPDVAARRLRHVVAVFFAVILSTALLAQGIYWFRSDIAASVPESRPYLVRACQRLSCSILPEARIDQLSIESSELTAAPGLPGVLNFSALLRNHRDAALAYPAIEITLTDARDDAVIRRVFSPTDYLRDERRLHLNEGFAPNSEFTVRLTFSTSGVATVGYRANLFYP
jgi:predicted Zn finger-like uncharacterized protein